MKSFDVIIIGGGPAGAATGLTILKKPGISICMLEQSNYSKPRVGEVLSPGLRPMLEYFDVWDSFKSENPLDAFSSKALWGNEELSVTDYLFTTHGSGWHLNRVAFDRMLTNKFKDYGGSLMTNTKFLKAVRHGDGWKVYIRSGKKEEILFTNYIVDSSGRKGSLVNNQKTVRVFDDRLIGVGCFGDIRQGSQLEQSILIEAVEYGWWYSAPTPGNKISIILMTDLDIVSELKAVNRNNWMRLLKSTKETSKQLKYIQSSLNPKSFLAHSSKLTIAGDKNWLAVGDAFSSHDPLSSSGIPHALGSGAFAGRVVVSSLMGNHNLLKHYTNEISNQYLSYLKTKGEYYNYEQRWPKSKFWKRRTDSLDIMAESPLETDLLIPEKPIHLNVDQYVDFKKMHSFGIPAHELVTKFKKKYPEVSDQAGILGLQEMIKL